MNVKSVFVNRAKIKTQINAFAHMMYVENVEFVLDIIVIQHIAQTGGLTMAEKDKEFRLCYVDDNIMYFTDNFEHQLGDDWNDAPYDCNAGEPYEWNEDEDEEWRNKHHGHLRYIGFKSDGWLKIAGQLGEPYNVPYSVEQINKGAVAWLYSDKAGGLYGGATIDEAIEWLKKASLKWGQLK